MSKFDFGSIHASKRSYRARLAALPVAEKLRMLEALRDRALQLKRAGDAARATRTAGERLSGQESRRAPSTDS